MFTPLHNYLDHSSIHGVKTMSRPRAIYRRWRRDKKMRAIYSCAGSTNSQ